MRALLCHDVFLCSPVDESLMHRTLRRSQDRPFPAKAVRIIVPFAPGGPNDLAVRPVAQKLHELLGQPFVIDYRAGANGIIGTELVAKSAPDGYTLLVISSSFTINASTYAKLPFDPIRDFAPVSSIATSDIIFVVNPTVPVPQRQGVRGAGEVAPGQAQLRVFRGPGGSLHLAAELLKMTAGIDMVHIAYKGAALAITDVIGGHVDSMFISAPGAIAQIKAGKVRGARDRASARRAPAPPRYGLIGPGSHAGVVARLQAAIALVLATPEVHERYIEGAIVIAHRNTPLICGRTWCAGARSSPAKLTPQ